MTGTRTIQMFNLDLSMIWLATAAASGFGKELTQP